MSINLAPPSEQTRPGGWLEKSLEKPSQPLLNTSRKKKNTEAIIKKNIANTLAETFSANSLQSTTPFLQNQRRETET